MSCSENRVWRLCSAQRLWSNHAKKRGPNRGPEPPDHDDLVEREFTATRPNELWITDITEHHAARGKLYACLIQDVFSKRIVGYSIGPRMPVALAVTALKNAIELRSPKGTVVHSDRGSQFRSNAFLSTLMCNGLVGSVGRVGACGDSAAMESFNSQLQKTVLDQRRWRTSEELRLAIVAWIETTHHRRRRQR